MERRGAAAPPAPPLVYQLSVAGLMTVVVGILTPVPAGVDHPMVTGLTAAAGRARVDR
jgi:hypothetical protein